MKVQKFSQDYVLKAPEAMQEARMEKLEADLKKVEPVLKLLLGAEFSDDEHFLLSVVHTGDLFITEDNHCAVHAGFGGRISAWLLYSEDMEDLEELIEFVSANYFQKDFFKVEAEPLHSNDYVIACLESQGFRKVGVRKMNRLIGNRWVDTLLMEKLNPALNESPVELIEIKKQDEGELPVQSEQGEEAACLELSTGPKRPDSQTPI